MTKIGVKTDSDYIKIKDSQMSKSSFVGCLLIWWSPTNFALTNEVVASYLTILRTYCEPMRTKTMSMDFAFANDMATY